MKKLFNCFRKIKRGALDFAAGRINNEGDEGNEGFDVDYSYRADEQTLSEEYADSPTYLNDSGYEYYDAGPDDFFVSVRTPKEFQAALEAGVRHIVLTAHLDMRQSPSPPRIKGKESLNNAVGRLEDTTVSIVVRITNVLRHRAGP